jgi:hypothetical protein
VWAGFGLVFNSYAGSERDQAYKEIRLFTNKDGSVDTKDLMKSELGCKIPLKAKRDGGSEVTIKVRCDVLFTVATMNCTITQCKLPQMMYYQGMLFVLYDSAGDGMWAECLTQPLDLNVSPPNRQTLAWRRIILLNLQIPNANCSVVTLYCTLRSTPSRMPTLAFLVRCCIPFFSF